MNLKKVVRINNDIFGARITVVLRINERKVGFRDTQKLFSSFSFRLARSRRHIQESGVQNIKPRIGLAKILTKSLNNIVETQNVDIGTWV